VSEQENKVPTAVEIERALRERRQQELEETNKDGDKEDATQPTKRLGIEKLKKSRKGLVVIICGLSPSCRWGMFLLCAVNYSFNVQF
jgi:type IV secretion system protein VirB10